MDALTEKDARRTVQLADHDTFGAVDDERALLGHVRDGTEIDVLNHRGEILVVRVGAVELQLGLQRHAVGEATLQALRDAVLRRVDVIVQELEDEIVARVSDGEVLGKHLVETLLLTFLRRYVELKEIPE